MPRWRRGPWLRNIYHFENFERVAIGFNLDSFHNGALFNEGLCLGRNSICTYALEMVDHLNALIRGVAQYFCASYALGENESPNIGFPLLDCSLVASS